MGDGAVRGGGGRRRAGRHGHGLRAGRRGVRTLLVDRADAGRATDAGAGILSPETTKRDDPNWVELVRAAGEHYDQLMPEARRRHGLGTGAGSCSSPRDASDVSAWEWVAERAPGATEISPDEARAMVPVLGDVVRALHHPAAARVDGRSCARRCGAPRSPSTVSRCARNRSTTCARSRPTRSSSRAARGPARSRQLGVKLPVGPLRGQIIHLGVDGHDTGAWPIVQPVYGYYMVPWAGRRVAVGATVEDAGFAADVTAGACTTCCGRRCACSPGSRRRRCARCASGLRPVSIDDTPILGALPGVPDVFVATGHGANGLLLGPCPARSSPISSAATNPRSTSRRWLQRASTTGDDQRSSLRARSAMMFFCTSVGPAPIVV